MDFTLLRKRLLSDATLALAKLMKEVDCIDDYKRRITVRNMVNDLMNHVKSATDRDIFIIAHLLPQVQRIVKIVSSQR